MGIQAQDQSNSNDGQKDVLDAFQVAELIGVHVETIRRLARSREIPCFKVGRDWRFRRGAVEEWMNREHSPEDRLSILVVDDEKSIRETIATKLRQEGYDVVAAPDGETAVKSFVLDQPDLVILDLLMPGMDGAEVLAQLHARDRRDGWLPVIILTGYPESDVMNRAMAYSPFTLLTKPVAFENLLTAVKEKLGNATPVPGA